MMQKRVHQRVLGITGPGMNNQSGRFIDYDQIAVFINDVERYGLRLRRDWLCGWFGNADLVAGSHEITGPSRLTIQSRCTGPDELLDPGPGKLWEPLRDEPIQPASGIVLRYG